MIKGIKNNSKNKKYPIFMKVFMIAHFRLLSLFSQVILKFTSILRKISHKMQVNKVRMFLVSYEWLGR